jgi:hypothetical protein
MNGDLMRYIAQVAIAFSHDAEGQHVFDIWESTLVLDSERPRQALAHAISNSRTVLDDPENWRALGYSNKPCLYAIRSLHNHVDLPRNNANRNSNCMMLTKVATVDEAEMAKIRAFEDVLVPYRVIHIG